MLNHKGTLEIKTDRLRLRRFEHSDAQAMFENWASDGEVTKYLSWPTHVDISVTKKVISDWIESYKSNEFYHWAIELKESGTIVGGITVVGNSNQNERCEIGYCIGQIYWGKGITAEALIAVNNFLFEKKVGYQRIEAIHYSVNEASGRVMLKAGMKYEGTKYGYIKTKHGEFVDCESYAIVKSSNQ